jgi:hypothetical protein
MKAPCLNTGLAFTARKNVKSKFMHPEVLAEPSLTNSAPLTFDHQKYHKVVLKQIVSCRQRNYGPIYALTCPTAYDSAQEPPTDILASDSLKMQHS